MPSPQHGVPVFHTSEMHHKPFLCHESACDLADIIKENDAACFAARAAGQAVATAHVPQYALGSARRHKESLLNIGYC